MGQFCRMVRVGFPAVLDYRQGWLWEVNTDAIDLSTSPTHEAPPGLV